MYAISRTLTVLVLASHTPQVSAPSNTVTQLFLHSYAYLHTSPISKYSALTSRHLNLKSHICFFVSGIFHPALYATPTYVTQPNACNNSAPSLLFIWPKFSCLEHHITLHSTLVISFFLLNQNLLPEPQTSAFSIIHN